jgi:hypothetical protein
MPRPKPDKMDDEAFTPASLMTWLLGEAVTYQPPFDRHAFYLHVLSVPTQWEDAFQLASWSNGSWCLVKWIEANYGSEQASKFLDAAIATIRSKPGDGADFIESGLRSLLSARRISETDGFPVGQLLIARYGDLELGKAYSFLSNVAPAAVFTRESVEKLGAYLSAMTPYCLGCFDSTQEHIPRFLGLTPIHCEPLGSLALSKPVPP